MSGFSEVIPVPCHWGVRDNYSYLCVLASDSSRCIIVDACEAGPLLRALNEHSLTPAAILTTHHHWDHVGANDEFVERFSVDVVGHERDRDRIPSLTQAVQHGDQFDAAGVRVRALHVPGHTQGSVVYEVDGRAFTGDTLFCGGCGRLLEGTAEQLHGSLEFLVSELPGETMAYTGHEYTQKNLEFATSILRLPALETRLAEVVERRSEQLCCAFGSLEEERATNLFLMCADAEVQKAVLRDRWTALAADARPLATFTQLRAWKDQA